MPLFSTLTLNDLVLDTLSCIRVFSFSNSLLYFLFDSVAILFFCLAVETVHLLAVFLHKSPFTCHF